MKELHQFCGSQKTKVNNDGTKKRKESRERGIAKELHSRLRDVYKNGILHEEERILSKRYPIKTPQSATTLQYILNTENAISV